MNETYDSLIDNIKKAEAEIFLWQGLIDKINGIQLLKTKKNFFLKYFDFFFRHGKSIRKFKMFSCNLQ